MHSRSIADALRGRLGSAVFARVAGPEGRATRARIHETPGPRWFGPERPIRIVHADASMFVGGLTALLLQSLHPLAMAAVSGHSGFQRDPWGRLQRTSTFLATTTFATAEDAQRAVDQVRGIHERVAGTAPDGRSYRASDPHLLTWVHIAEVDCFLRAHQRYGAHPLSTEDSDGYLADTARVAAALGAEDPPTTRAALDARMAAYRPELHGTTQARDTAHYLLRKPPLPTLARLPYAGLAMGAIDLLPDWARADLGLRSLSPRSTVTARAATRAVTRTIRWAMGS